MYRHKSTSPDWASEAALEQGEGKPLALYSTAAWRGLQLTRRYNGALQGAGQPSEMPTPELVVSGGARRVYLFPTVRLV